ncbi:MAG: alpha/beta hydrolase [Chlamydiales bacterium]|nr:alpha/beta hydrolase [Chlamydiales bacterium]
MQKAIFIPGLGENAKAYAHQIKNLADCIEPTVFDYDAFETTEDMTQALLDQITEPCTLIGHSMGGFLAQKCAARAGEKIQNLILINTWAAPSQDFIKQNKMASAAMDAMGLETLFNHQIPLFFFDPKSALVKDTIEALLEKPPEVYKRLINALSTGEDLTAILPKISAKTLVIHGRQDVLFSLDQHEQIKNLIPQAQLTIIEESGHHCPTEQPQAVTALIRLALT